ncbi:MAG: hypothetical protein ABIT20_09815 [Gemmatimonadaceae bacterium]
MHLIPRRNLRPGPQLLAVPLLLVLMVCRTEQRTPSSRYSQGATDSVDVSVEKPVWKFGEATTRTDELPAELDSMVAWGDYPEAARPVAYGIDLNGDGSKEWFVRANHGLCGFGGCPTALMTRAADGRFIVSLDGLVREVYVTNRRAAGWPVLWVLVGGRDGGLFRMEVKNGAYFPSRTLRRTADEWTATSESLAALLKAAPSR